MTHTHIPIGVGTVYLSTHYVYQPIIESLLNAEVVDLFTINTYSKTHSVRIIIYECFSWE